MKPVRRWVVAATIAGVFSGAAFGIGIGGIAFADDRGTATALLNELANDSAHKDATAAIVQRGRDALERATRMRAAGDEAHAQLADGLAREEAEAGHDLVRALDAERMADDARRAATDAGTVGERERALLEEAIARNGRLRAEIDGLGKGHGKEKEPRAAKVGAMPATSDAGAPAKSPPSVSANPGPSKTDASKVDGGAR
jgi:hypothetical protein